MLHFGASLSKQWHKGEKSNNSGWLLLLHLCNQGRWSMCMCVYSHSSVIAVILASFPGPAQLSVTFLYCKQWKAGRGLGTRLQYSLVRLSFCLGLCSFYCKRCVYK